MSDFSIILYILYASIYNLSVEYDAARRYGSGCKFEQWICAVDGNFYFVSPKL